MVAKKIRYWSYGLVALVALVEADAGSWTAPMNDGSVLRVDPETRRAMRYYDGGMAPMWDGTHRLEDGSVVIVRDGQAVPTEGMIGAWKSGPGEVTELEDQFCAQLVRKTCGFHAECATEEPCSLAKQLLRLEREEQRRAPISAGARPLTESSEKCKDGMKDDAGFPVCAQARPGEAVTPCRKLVEAVCGKDNQCRNTQPCDLADQLLQMELEERLISARPDAVTVTGQQCRQAMENPFFQACQQ